MGQTFQNLGWVYFHTEATANTKALSWKSAQQFGATIGTKCDKNEKWESVR